ncbi:MAG TPA: Zn-dependent hydrolase [Bacteroidales bacterium]|nr:Zn-dependent hydrolase [Bacteroidales bacterium]
MQKKLLIISLIFFSFVFISCTNKDKKEDKKPQSKIEKLLSNYADVKLETDLSILSKNQKEMLPYLVEAAKLIDELYWAQTCPKMNEIEKSITDESVMKYFKINYGPWDRLNGMEPFVDGIGQRYDGANFYPPNMSFQEFDEFTDLKKYNSYTLIRRNELGSLQTIPYHIAYKEKLVQIADLMKKAAELADNRDFKKYLELRAEALLNDSYYKSDITWMEMKDNIVDFIVGPIEDVEDRLYYTKTSYQSMILIKDKQFSKDLEKYSLLLPYLQKSLPVDVKYKTEIAGKLSDIMVYDVIYCSGYWNTGSKKIAITLPIDGQVQLKVGSRKLQFKNVMGAKFDKILMPISKILIADNQLKHVTEKAFFENTMFYEVGSALGIRNTINGNGLVRDALKDQHNVISECKNDILSLFFVTKLYEMGEMSSGDLMDNYVTYMTDVFRSVRFGIANDQGVANMIRFYYFQEMGAFSRDSKTGKYSINFDKMKEAMLKLSEEILVIQGDGNYEAAKKLVNEKGFIRDELLNDLYKIQKERIPKDVVFIQGLDQLGLTD